MTDRFLHERKSPFLQEQVQHKPSENIFMLANESTTPVIQTIKSLELINVEKLHFAFHICKTCRAGKFFDFYGSLTSVHKKYVPLCISKGGDLIFFVKVVHDFSYIKELYDRF